MIKTTSPLLRYAPVLLLSFLCVAALYSCRGKLPPLVAVRDFLDEILGFKYRPGYVLPTSTTSQDFFGRAYIRTRTTSVEPDSAATATQASALVGFPVVEPAIAGMEPVDFFNISKAHAYDVHIDLEEARRILAASPALAAELSAAAQDFQVKVEIPAGVVLHQSQGERWYFLIENPSGVVQVEDSHAALYDSLQDLGLRSLGLTADEARRVNQELGMAIFFAIPPTFLTRAEAVAVNGAPALLFSQSSVEPAHRLLIWRAGGMQFGLMGSLPPEELLQVAGSLQ